MGNTFNSTVTAQSRPLSTMTSCAPTPGTSCGYYAPPTDTGAVGVIGTAAAVPEIDPSSAIGGLTLLFGGLAVLRGRRPARPVA